MVRHRPQSYESRRFVVDASRHRIVIEITTVTDDTLILEGRVDGPEGSPPTRLSFVTDTREVPAEHFSRRGNWTLSDGTGSHPVGFKVSIPLAGVRRIEPVLSAGTGRVPARMSFGKFARLNRRMKATYFVEGGHLLFLKGNTIRLRTDPPRSLVFKRELKYLWELTARKRRYAASLHRIAYFVLRVLKGRGAIWLVSDRIVSAGDNGEAFFRYLAQHPVDGVRPYFAISRRSSDFARMKQVGRVVTHGSLRYRLLFLLSEAVISSAADEYVINAFGEDRSFLRDLYRFDFVFLQHGVIKHDLSEWLGRYKKNIRLFVTSALPEYGSILQADYHYGEDVLKLTGLPRHDALRSGVAESEKKIVFMPTWRKSLTSPLNPVTGLRSPFPGFTGSEFFRFWDSLIGDPRLLDQLRSHGYHAKFFMHPALVQEVGHFRSNDVVSVERSCDYAHELKTAGLLITDYSSVVFDFAMLGKPVVYAQFDRADFFAGHLHDEGYFDYERDGFGPVCVDHVSTVAAIVDALEHHCVMGEEYARRASKFFFRPPVPSSQLVLEAINDVRGRRTGSPLPGTVRGRGR